MEDNQIGAARNINVRSDQTMFGKKLREQIVAFRDPAMPFAIVRDLIQMLIIAPNNALEDRG